MVEPTEHDPLEVEGHALAQDSEVDLAVDVGEERGVEPGADDEPGLAGRRGTAPGPHAEVVAEGAAEEDVVPPAHVQGGDGDLAVARLDVPGAPVVVVVRVGQPVLVVGG